MAHDPVVGTPYNTLLHFAPDGSLFGAHRKLMPTGAERLVWGQGDGSGLAVFDTPFGRLGGHEFETPEGAAVLDAWLRLRPDAVRSVRERTGAVVGCSIVAEWLNLIAAAELGQSDQPFLDERDRGVGYRLR